MPALACTDSDRKICISTVLRMCGRSDSRHRSHRHYYLLYYCDLIASLDALMDAVFGCRHIVHQAMSRGFPTTQNSDVWHTSSRQVLCGKYLSRNRTSPFHCHRLSNVGNAWKTSRCPMHLPTNTRTLGVYDVLVAAGPSGLFHGAVLLTLLVCVKRLHERAELPRCNSCSPILREE
jgi:hypothetical protein